MVDLVTVAILGQQAGSSLGSARLEPVRGQERGSSRGAEQRRRRARCVGLRLLVGAAGRSARLAAFVSGEVARILGRRRKAFATSGATVLDQVPAPVERLLLARPPDHAPNEAALPHLEVHYETLLAGHMRRVGARVRESLAAIETLERLFAAMDPYVLLKVMLELERFAAFFALEPSEYLVVELLLISNAKLGGWQHLVGLFEGAACMLLLLLCREAVGFEGRLLLLLLLARLVPRARRHAHAPLGFELGLSIVGAT